MDLTTEQKIKLITRNCQEVLTNEDLSELVNSGRVVRHYIGLEISGQVHLGTGLMNMGKIADFLQAGVECHVFLADFHTYLNNKLDGTWESIRRASDTYFKHALIASCLCVGADPSKVNFISGKDLYSTRFDHWETFMKVGKYITLSRNKRSISIMGKEAGDDVDMATLFYPPLQVADIYTMGINLAHAGMDQRKVHVVARETQKQMRPEEPIVCVHHNLIAGLTGPEKEGVNDNESLKMSKSKPSSAVFVHDSPEEIRAKLRAAYGPPKVVEHNPLLNWVKTLVFWGEEEGGFKIEREAKFGGNLEYKTYAQVEKDYADGALFPLDLKNGLAEWLINKLAPARKYFEENEEAREGLKFIQQFAKK